MTTEQKLQWLQQYLSNCLGEELPAIQGNYTFGNHTIPDDAVLAELPETILNGRTIRTYNVDMFLQKCENIEVLTNETFAVMCTNDPVLNVWFQWNLDRGMISL